MSLDEILDVSNRFLASELVVRLAPDSKRRRPPSGRPSSCGSWKTACWHDSRELSATPAAPIAPNIVEAAIAAEPKRLGRDQAAAVGVLCGDGPAVRALTAPAGYGKTTAVHAAATASRSAGRPVVAVAPTHKAVAELRANDLDAHTVARLRRRLRDTPLAPNTTVIVDETSQIGTRDAADILAARSPPPLARRCGSWATPAKPSRSLRAAWQPSWNSLAEAGTSRPPGSRVNRRQRDPAEQAALTKYRAGDLDASQAIRTEHGWEHEQPTPGDTRTALADAAVADADRHGAEHVAVLAVSHADCEDLADHIRAIRAARGELRGPTLTGPGWGPDQRVYAAGDRVLVHANLYHGPERWIVNGSTGTVLAVTADGLALSLDRGEQVLLDRDVVAGVRPDGTPNISHAWARTVDGAQGGTWRQVHLLGTPVLDRFTGYVGQCHGQLPTHTWNTRPEPDHPLSLLADDRSPGEAVLDAMRRAEPKTLAAHDDPWVLDRRLRAERDDHAAVVATATTGPPSRRSPGTRCARPRHRGTPLGNPRAHPLRVRTRRLGPLTRLRRGGRDDITHAENAVSRRASASRARRDRRPGCGRRRRASATGGRRTRSLGQREGWRLVRIAEIDHTLAHHWAEVVFRAVRADDPLAFAPTDSTPLKPPSETTTVGSPPACRWTGATPSPRRADLRHHEHNLRFASREVAKTRAAVEDVGRRHWGRRDETAIEQARARLGGAESDLARAADAVAGSRHALLRSDVPSVNGRPPWINGRRTRTPGRGHRRHRPTPSTERGRTGRRRHREPRQRLVAHARSHPRQPEAALPPGAASPNGSRPARDHHPEGGHRRSTRLRVEMNPWRSASGCLDGRHRRDDVTVAHRRAPAIIDHATRLRIRPAPRRSRTEPHGGTPWTPPIERWPSNAHPAR